MLIFRASPMCFWTTGDGNERGDGKKRDDLLPCSFVVGCLILKKEKRLAGPVKFLWCPHPQTNSELCEPFSAREEKGRMWQLTFTQTRAFWMAEGVGRIYGVPVAYGRSSRCSNEIVHRQNNDKTLRLLVQLPLG